MREIIKSLQPKQPESFASFVKKGKQGGDNQIHTEHVTTSGDDTYRIEKSIYPYPDLRPPVSLEEQLKRLKKRGSYYNANSESPELERLRAEIRFVATKIQTPPKENPRT